MVPSVFQCRHCVHIVSEKSQLTAHFKEQHPGKAKIATAIRATPPELRCTSLPYRSDNRSQMELHLKKKKAHLKRGDDVSPVKRLRQSRSSVYECHVCAYTSTSKQRLNRHVSGQHAGEEAERLHRCGRCDFAADYASHLDRHVDSVHRDADADKLHACSHCDLFRSNHKNALARHVRETHAEGRKIFRCADCGYNTPREDTVKDHVRVRHGGEKARLRKHYVIVAAAKKDEHEVAESHKPTGAPKSVLKSPKQAEKATKGAPGVDDFIALDKPDFDLMAGPSSGAFGIMGELAGFADMPKELCASDPKVEDIRAPPAVTDEMVAEEVANRIKLLDQLRLLRPQDVATYWQGNNRTKSPDVEHKEKVEEQPAKAEVSDDVSEDDEEAVEMRYNTLEQMLRGFKGSEKKEETSEKEEEASEKEEEVVYVDATKPLVVPLEVVERAVAEEEALEKDLEKLQRFFKPENGFVYWEDMEGADQMADDEMSDGDSDGDEDSDVDVETVEDDKEAGETRVLLDKAVRQLAAARSEREAMTKRCEELEESIRRSSAVDKSLTPVEIGPEEGSITDDHNGGEKNAHQAAKEDHGGADVVARLLF